MVLKMENSIPKCQNKYKRLDNQQKQTKQKELGSCLTGIEDIQLNRIEGPFF